MQIQDVIEKRRSIRHYLDTSLREEDIARILKAGTLAPSAHNKQPWFIHVVENKFTIYFNRIDLSKALCCTLEWRKLRWILFIRF